MDSSQPETWSILLVDDDQEDYMIMHDMLKQAQGKKMVVEWAPSYQAGWEHMKEDTYDAILIDYDLGAHTGIELIRDFVDQGCSTPLILYTGRGSYTVDTEAMQAGATLYIAKNEATPLFLERSIRYSIERKQIEQALRESEAKLRSLFSLLPVGVAILDSQGNLLNVNPALEEIIDLSEQTLLSSDYLKLAYLHPDGSPMTADELPGERAFREQRPIENVEIGFVKADGEIVWGNVSAVPLPYTDWRMAVVTVDVTTRKQTEDALRTSTEQLEQSNQALEDFAFIASHDLHEPLRKIQSLADQLEGKYASALDETGQGYVTGMGNAARRLDNMLSNLLDYSRASRKGMPFDAVDLHQTAEEVLSDLEVNVQQTQAQIELGDLPVIEADPLQIYQLLQNLLTNALKYHRPGVPPHIKVYDTPAPERFIEMVVEDDGIGFDPSFTADIFRPFFRLHEGTNEFAGAGIGLATCAKIVQRHKGQILAESTPGVGSKFRVLLPRKQSPCPVDPANP